MLTLPTYSPTIFHDLFPRWARTAYALAFVAGIVAAALGA